jgi:FMN-dependent NADH-azoreductase
MTVLRIDSSARGAGSNSRALTQYLVEQLVGPVIERDLGQQPLPQISSQDLIDLHVSADSDRDSFQQHLKLSQQLIDELIAADTIVFGAPMYNYGVPTVLKQWMDYVCRADLTFRYTENGPAGLTDIKRAFIVTSAGGTPVGSNHDFASRHLEQVCHFIGIQEVIHIDASGSKRTPEKIIAQGKQQIDAALANIHNALKEVS